MNSAISLHGDPRRSNSAHARGRPRNDVREDNSTTRCEVVGRGALRTSGRADERSPAFELPRAVYGPQTADGGRPRLMERSRGTQAATFQRAAFSHAGMSVDGTDIFSMSCRPPTAGFFAFSRGGPTDRRTDSALTTPNGTPVHQTLFSGIPHERTELIHSSTYRFPPCFR